MNASSPVEAKIDLAILLDRVEQGEKITPHEAVERLLELRRGTTLGGIDWRELRDEGR